MTAFEKIVNCFRMHVPIVLLCLWVVLCFFLPVPWQKTPTTDKDLTFHKVLLLSDGVEKPRSLAYEAVLLDSLPSLGRVTPKQLVLYFSKDSAARHQAGDVLLIRATLEDGRAYVPPTHCAFLAHRSYSEVGLLEGRLRMRALALRKRLEEHLESLPFRPENLALVESILLGDRRLLSLDQKEAFSDSGAMHVLAVSGLHVGIISQIFLFVLTLGGLLFIPWECRILRALQRLLLILLIWGYAFLTGLSVSVMRSALMFSVMPLGNMHHDSPLKYNSLAFAALVILIINPSALYTPSFLLSFGAVLAILYYLTRWRQQLSLFLKADSQSPALKTISKILNAPLLKGIVDLLLVSFAAQIGTLPFTLLFFGQTSNYFFLTNLVVLPVAQFLLMPFGLLTLFFGVIHFPHLPASFTWIGSTVDWLSSACARVTDFSASMMNKAVCTIQYLPGAVSFFTITPPMIILLISSIFLVTLSFRVAHRWLRFLLLFLAFVLLFAMLFLYARAIGY